MEPREGTPLYPWTRSAATTSSSTRRNHQEFRGAALCSEDADARGLERTSDDHGDAHNASQATPRRDTPSSDIPLQIHAWVGVPSSSTARLSPLNFAAALH